MQTEDEMLHRIKVVRSLRQKANKYRELGHAAAPLHKSEFFLESIACAALGILQELMNQNPSHDS